MFKRRNCMELSLKMLIFQFFNFMLEIAILKDELAHFFFNGPKLFDKMFIFHSFFIIFFFEIVSICCWWCNRVRKLLLIHWVQLWCKSRHLPLWINIVGNINWSVEISDLYFLWIVAQIHAISYDVICNFIVVFLPWNFWTHIDWIEQFTILLVRIPFLAIVGGSQLLWLVIRYVTWLILDRNQISVLLLLLWILTTFGLRKQFYIFKSSRIFTIWLLDQFDSVVISFLFFIQFNLLLSQIWLWREVQRRVLQIRLAGHPIVCILHVASNLTLASLGRYFCFIEFSLLAQLFLFLDLSTNFMVVYRWRISVRLNLRVIFVLPGSLLLSIFHNLVAFIVMNYSYVVVVCDVDVGLVAIWVFWWMTFIHNLQSVKIIHISRVDFNWLVGFEIEVLRRWKLVGLTATTIPFVDVSHSHFWGILEFGRSHHHNRWPFHSAFDTWSVCFPHILFMWYVRQLLLHRHISLNWIKRRLMETMHGGVHNLSFGFHL